MGKFTQIGWFNLPEDKVFTNQYECAAWHEDVLVKAGRYPVEVYDLKWLDSGRIDFSCHHVYVNMEGVIVSDYFPTMLFGVPVGEEYDSTKNAGKRSEHHNIVATYDVTEEAGFELFPEYEIREEHFQSCIDGSDMTTHEIWKRGADDDVGNVQGDSRE